MSIECEPRLTLENLFLLGSPWYLLLDYLQDVVAISTFPLLRLCVSLVLLLDRIF